MAASLWREFVHVLPLKGLSSPHSIFPKCHYINKPTIRYNVLNRGIATEIHNSLVGISGHFISATAKGAPSCCIVPYRQYGRKMKPNPPKITYFEYSGDLRNLPELNKSTLLYTYAGLEDQLEGHEVLKRLCSLEFASAKEFANHRQELIRDRIVELFGPDSELEQEIALLTLKIRQMIPYCIAHRQDKRNKIWLVGYIFRRRRLLTMLRELDHERFEWLLRELKIRYVIPKDREKNKGLKHNLLVATQNDALTQKRQKLEALKVKFEEEKKAFFEHKAKVLSDIERDLAKFGLSRDFLTEIKTVKKDTSTSSGLKQKGDQKQQ